MARGRLISRSLGSSRKYHELLRAGGKLGEFCQLLFPLVIANTDDFGRMPGDAFTVKNVVLPSSPRLERDFDKALDIMADVGLLARYQVDGAVYLQIEQFDLHQANLHKRTESRYPVYPGTEADFRNLRDAPGISRKFRETPAQFKGTEFKGTEENPEENSEPRLRRTADARFAEFWAAYPKKKAKDDALRAWNKRRPTPELLGVMLAAIAKQRLSPDWCRNGGQFIPYPATWLNQARWTDEADESPPLMSAVTAFNLASSDDAEKLILEEEARRTGTHGHRG